jgi:hypothetical protein
MSRYHTLYTSTGTAKFQTLATSAVSTSTQLDARRITLFTGPVQQFVAFGTSTVTATTSSAIVPANSAIDYNFSTGQYVAVLSSNGASVVTILDSD